MSYIPDLKIAYKSPTLRLYTRSEIQDRLNSIYLSIISFKCIETLFLDHEQSSEVDTIKWREDTKETYVMQISFAYRSVPSFEKVINRIVPVGLWSGEQSAENNTDFKAWFQPVQVTKRKAKKEGEDNFDISIDFECDDHLYHSVHFFFLVHLHLEKLNSSYSNLSIDRSSACLVFLSFLSLRKVLRYKQNQTCENISFGIIVS